MNIYKKLEKLQNQDSVCLIGHIDPDSDALASMVVFQEFLRKHFKLKKVDIFADCETKPIIFNKILENNILNPNPIQYSAVIILDTPNLDRIGKYKSIYQQTKNKFIIDHHATNCISADLKIIEMCSSTCEIVFSILEYFNFKLSIKNQEKLYAGLITDTNNFTVGNFGKRTFEIAAKISENIKVQKIYLEYLSNTSLKQMQLLSIAIQNIESIENEQIIISYASKNDLSNLNASTEDCSVIINKLATVQGNQLTCFIYNKSNSYYVSMRAKDKYDVSKIAKINGGGGHKGAAAFLSNKTLDEIKKYIRIEFSKLLLKK